MFLYNTNLFITLIDQFHEVVFDDVDKFTGTDGCNIEYVVCYGARALFITVTTCRPYPELTWKTT